MIKPVIKWVGGKTQLLQTLIKILPNSFNRYYEPFFGGGSLLFSLQPHKAIINDLNPILINLYGQIRDNCDSLIELLLQVQRKFNSMQSDEDRSVCYYSVREQFNDFLRSKELTCESAALFIFLNKLGFNGLYRVNSAGLYNVPFNHNKSVTLFNKQNIESMSNYLKTSVDILCGDFYSACQTAQEGDFIFFDSPYYSTFDKYQSDGFTEQDHLRLHNLFTSLTERGCLCMLTNSDCEYIRTLYARFNIQQINVSRRINCDSKNRAGRELIITNYDYDTGGTLF